VLKNLTDRPVLLVLSSGDALRLSPGQSSPVLAEVEVTNNPKVDKLVAQRVIAIDTGHAAARAAGRRANTGDDQPAAEEVGAGAEGAAEGAAVDEKESPTRSRSRR
jgi:hypothetical protein